MWSGKGDLVGRGGAKVLFARGTEVERELPFAVMRQLLDPVLRACEPPERERLLDGAAAMALPALEEHPSAGQIDAFAVFAGLYWLIDGIAATAPLQLHRGAGAAAQCLAPRRGCGLSVGPSAGLGGKGCIDARRSEVDLAPRPRLKTRQPHGRGKTLRDRHRPRRSAHSERARN